MPGPRPTPRAPGDASPRRGGIVSPTPATRGMVRASGPTTPPSPTGSGSTTAGSPSRAPGRSTSRAPSRTRRSRARSTCRCSTSPRPRPARSPRPSGAACPPPRSGSPHADARRPRAGTSAAAASPPSAITPPSARHGRPSGPSPTTWSSSPTPAGPHQAADCRRRASTMRLFQRSARGQRLPAHRRQRRRVRGRLTPGLRGRGGTGLSCHRRLGSLSLNWDRRPLPIVMDPGNNWMIPTSSPADVGFRLAFPAGPSAGLHRRSVPRLHAVCLVPAVSSVQSGSVWA